jgi:hypothetical protein
MDQHLFTLTSMSNLIAAIRPLYVFIDNVLKLQSARNYIKIRNIEQSVPQSRFEKVQLLIKYQPKLMEKFLLKYFGAKLGFHFSYLR